MDLNVKTKIIEVSGNKIVEFISDNILIENVQDVLDLLVNQECRGANMFIIHENNLPAAFFDLKTGMAGEILQKFTTYNIRAAIIGDFSKFSSKSLKALIIESNKHGQILFVESIDEAIKKFIRA